jgi:hypothetical protein
MASASSLDYPWYGAISEPGLEQGDILFGCPVFDIPSQAIGGGLYAVQVREQNVIVLTQSCDLAVRADGSSLADDVILCPIYSRSELEHHKVFGKAQGWEDARKGRHNGYHVLNQCTLAGHEFDFLLVDLRRVYTLSTILVREFAVGKGGRVRLLPPYREHLSQAFARFFMRVGLPVDVPAFH